MANPALSSSSPINPSACSLKFAFYKLRCHVDKRSDIRRNGIGIDCDKIASVWIVSRLYDVTLPFSGPNKYGINEPNLD